MLVFCGGDIGVQHQGIKAPPEQLFHRGVDHLVRAATAFESPSARRWLQVKLNLLQKHNFILVAFTISEHSEVFVGQSVPRAKLQPEVVTETEETHKKISEIFLTAAVSTPQTSEDSSGHYLLKHKTTLQLQCKGEFLYIIRLIQQSSNLSGSSSLIYLVIVKENDAIQEQKLQPETLQTPGWLLTLLSFISRLVVG